MSSIIEGDKRDPFDLIKGDAVEIYLWSGYVTEQIAGTIVTKNGQEILWDVGLCTPTTATFHIQMTMQL